eukprot:872692-Rhodomonas_salina.1
MLDSQHTHRTHTARTSAHASAASEDRKGDRPPTVTGRDVASALPVAHRPSTARRKESSFKILSQIKDMVTSHQSRARGPAGCGNPVHRPGPGSRSSSCERASCEATAGHKQSPSKPQARPQDQLGLGHPRAKPCSGAAGGGREGCWS